MAATLKRSYDRKVSPYSSGKPNDLRAKVGNSFGISAIDSCPGSTESCRKACYAAKLENAWSTVRAQMADNLAALRAAKTTDRMAGLLYEMIDEYRQEVMRLRTRLDLPIPLSFRIHWDGDFFSVAYAKAWRTVILSNPDIQFWVYTRSFTARCNVVPTLVDIPNLALYLSADADNNELAMSVAEQYADVRLAILAPTFAEGRGIAGDAPAANCPENAKRIPLVNEANGEGACIACGLCVDGRKNVLFAALKR